MNEILIIAVIYNTYSETINFLKSIESQNYKFIKVNLVDNSEIPDSTFEKKLAAFKINIVYLKSPKNLGYFGGAKYGLNVFLEKNDLPKFIIVCNVDVEIKQKGFFEKLSEIQIDSDSGVIAPAIISKRWKTDSNPKIIARYSRKKMNFFLFISSNRLIHNFYTALSYFKKNLKFISSNIIASNRNKSKYANKNIYAPHGSFIIFYKQFFEKGGTLNHISFLFGEEIFIAETARKLDLKVVYKPELIVSDSEHASTGFFYSKKITDFMKQSSKDIISKYYTLF